MINHSSIDVLMVQRACAALYPPTMNHVRALRETGLRVAVLDLEGEGYMPWPEGVPHYTAHRAWDARKEAPPSLAVRWWRERQFQRVVHRTVRQLRPRLLWAYDVFGSAAVRPALGSCLTVYHFHELWESSVGAGRGLRRALAKTRSRVSGADRVVCADQMRAEHMAKWAGLSRMPDVVMNCPWRQDTAVESILRETLAGRGIHPGRCVGYLGSVGWNQALPEVAASMRFWPEVAWLVLVGTVRDDVREAILNEASRAGAADRVCFLGPQPHERAWALAAGFDVGLGLIQPNDANLRYAAGAVNKRFEYMALGVPQLADTNPGVPALVEGEGVGRCADPFEPKAIGQAVAGLLADPEALAGMAARARELHLSRYHMAAQFAPLVAWAREMVERSASERCMERVG